MGGGNILSLENAVHIQFNMNVSSQPPKIVFHEKFPYVTHDAVSVMSQ